jgi:hypothetical protein
MPLGPSWCIAPACFWKQAKSKREKETKRKKSGESVTIIDVKAPCILSDPALNFSVQA